MNLKIRTRVTFAAAHRLLNYPGKCSRLHGHNWVVEIVVSGSIDSRGFVEDFTEIKRRIIEKFDHKTLLCKDDPLINVLPMEDLVILNDNPTCEVLALEIANMIPNARIIRVWENDDSYAEVVVDESL